MAETAGGRPDPNYDENKVPVFPLPCPLDREDGSKVTTKEEWENFRRAEVLALVEKHLFGKLPAAPEQTAVTVLGEKEVFGGLGTRKSIRLTFKGQYAENVNFDILVYLPCGNGPFPCAIGLNFCGNHSVESDPDIAMPDYPWPDGKLRERGDSHRRWVPEYLLERGFALITGCYQQLFPDVTEGAKNSIFRLSVPQDVLNAAVPGEYTAISGWAWGLVRIMDYIETVPEIDSSKVIVTGHSRLGKTALWAGANDQRFSVVVSNDSGCGGAALSKREYGETIEIMNIIFPHWLTPQAKLDGVNIQETKYDQNFLLALAAPRALAVASASEDLWADPKGEFLGLAGTNSVYALYGRPEINTEPVPGGNDSIDNGIRHYHCRVGKHDILQYDWEKYLDFARRVWAKP